MIIIETSIGSNTFISGIFSNSDAASVHLSSFPFRVGEVTVVQNLNLSYPLYILEQQWDRMLYTDEVGLRKALKSMAEEFTPEEADEPVCNVYTVKADFEPRTAGVDEMGLLRHRHVMGDDLQNIDALMERVRA